MSDETSNLPAEDQGRSVSPKEVGAVVVGVLAIVFCFLNHKKTKINFFGWQPTTYLWIWMIVLLVVGVLVGLLLPYGRKKK